MATEKLLLLLKLHVALVVMGLDPIISRSIGHLGTILDLSLKYYPSET